jgi:TonB family protein
MPQGLHTLLTDADYPEEAIRNNEQGTVAFRLDVASDGKPRGCSVLSSSGSATLDATTCRIMTERARFQPARDAKGKPTADQVTARISWRMPTDEMPPRMKAAFDLWTGCVLGEAAKLVPGDLPADQVAGRAFAGCTALEAIVSQEVDGPAALERPRNSMASAIALGATKARQALNTPTPDAPKAR